MKNNKRENIFKFKQFSVRNELSAMKVGTDGVLLGAWCDISGAKKVLDVGTGTGLIALMVAQRCDATIVGVEIDSDAANEATLNAQSSPWGNRVLIINADFVKLSNEVGIDSVDHIVSNPPYFDTAIVAPDSRRAMARHGASLDFKSLIELSSRILIDQGRLSLISPVDRKDDILYATSLCRLSLSRYTEVYPTPKSAPSRILWEFVKGDGGGLEKSQLTIQLSPGVYTPEYIELTREFYLKM